MKINLKTSAVLFKLVIAGAVFAAWGLPEAEAAPGDSGGHTQQVTPTPLPGGGGAPQERPDKMGRVMAFFVPPPSGGGTVVPLPVEQPNQMAAPGGGEAIDGGAASPSYQSLAIPSDPLAVPSGLTSTAIFPDPMDSLDIKLEPEVLGCRRKAADPFFTGLGHGGETEKKFSLALSVSGNGSAISGFTTLNGPAAKTIGLRWQRQSNYVNYLPTPLPAPTQMGEVTISPRYVFPFGISHAGDLITGSYAFKISGSLLWQKSQFYYVAQPTPPPLFHFPIDLEFSSHQVQCTYDSAGFAIAEGSQGIAIAGYASEDGQGYTPSPAVRGCDGRQSRATKTTDSSPPIEVLTSSPGLSSAVAVSLNGQRFAVNGFDITTSTAYSYTDAPPYEYVELGSPSQGPISSTLAEAISSNGYFIVGTGYVNGTGSTQAVMWDASSGSVSNELGYTAYQSLLEGYYPIASQGRGISSSGSTVVGTVQMNPSPGFPQHPCLSAFQDQPEFYVRYWMQQEAFIWTPVAGLRNLKSVLLSLPDLTGDSLAEWTLCEATAISADGSTVVGFGVHEVDVQGTPTPRPEAFVARIKPLYQDVPCDFSVSEVGQIGIAE